MCRRVQLLSRRPDDGAERAIEIAERFAAGADDTRVLAHEPRVATIVANAEGTTVIAVDDTVAAAAAAALAAARGAAGVAAAVAAAGAAGAAHRSAAVAGAAAAKPDVEDDADDAAGDAYYDSTKAAEIDFDNLLAPNLGRYPELGQPIDPSERGPLGSFWPQGQPKWVKVAIPDTDVGEVKAGERPPDLLLVWDPAVLDEQRYARLVALLGDLVRAEGGLGIERIRSLGIGVPSGAGVHQ